MEEEVDGGVIWQEGGGNFNNRCVLRVEAQPLQECGDIQEGCRAEDDLREEGPEVFKEGSCLVGLPILVKASELL